MRSERDSHHGMVLALSSMTNLQNLYITSGHEPYQLCRGVAATTTNLPSPQQQRTPAILQSQKNRQLARLIQSEMRDFVDDS